MQCKVKEGSGDRTHTAHFSLGSRAKRAQEVRSVSPPLANSQVRGASGCMLFACLHHEFENWQEGEEDSSTLRLSAGTKMIFKTTLHPSA